MILCATVLAPAIMLVRAVSQTATTRSQKTAAVTQNFSSFRRRYGSGAIPCRVATTARAPVMRATAAACTVDVLLWQCTTSGRDCLNLPYSLHTNFHGAAGPWM